MITLALTLRSAKLWAMLTPVVVDDDVERHREVLVWSRIDNAAHKKYKWEQGKGVKAKTEKSSTSASSHHFIC